MNKIIISGNLVRDPEHITSGGATSITKFTIANNHGPKGTDLVSFIDVISFGVKGDAINKYFTKGKKILVEGRIKQESWDAKDGTKKSKIVILLENFEFMNGEMKVEEAQESVQNRSSDVKSIGSFDIPF